MKGITHYVLDTIIVAMLAYSDLEAHGQGTLLISNLSKPSSGAVMTGQNSWLAQSFYNNGSNFSESGDRGFRLDSVQLLMSTPLGNPNGFSVAFYGSSRDEGPGSQIGSLSGSDPNSAGVFTYTASNITLASSSSYWIVVTGGSLVEQGSYSWNLASNGSFDSENGSVLAPYYDSSSTGSIWTRNGNRPLQFAVYVTPIPEPSSLILIGLGGWFLITCLARRSRSKPFRI